MSRAKDIEFALTYLLEECNRAGYPETAYLLEVARLSLLDQQPKPPRAEAPREFGGNVVRLRA